ncbi:PxKF domain-containing protein [Nocardioides taihuensis]|uniref:PxKF domain-containing protein n=1 Tax=Nocardioides taihuensis TaxID=1835606 RepID=A0ABW0BMZ9_9ACTN
MSRSVLGRAFATSAAILLVGAGPALADDVANRLDTSIDATAEVMSLNVGGVAKSTTLYISPANGDGKQGCNLTGSTTLVVNVASSNTAVATVSPSSVTFGSCGDTPAVTVTPVSAGSSTISVSQASNNTGGTFNLAPATFDVVVAPPANTAPTVAITGVSGGSTYELGAVPAAGCTVTDAEDGPQSFAATVTGPATGLGTFTASCSYTDAGGLTATSLATYSIVDTHDPVITFQSRTPAANDHGWNKDDVTVTWTCSDSGSGVVSSTVSATVSTEGADQTVTGTCADHAGNAASDTVGGISIDRTAPDIEIGFSPSANDAGWNNGDVTVAWTCTDALAGAVDAGGSKVLVEGENQSWSATCTDKAGNTASDGVDDIDVDETDPVITFEKQDPEANAAGWNNTPVSLEWSCSDTLSGPVDETVTRTIDTEGTGQSATGTCTDKAGNTESDTRTGVDVDLTDPELTLLGEEPSGWHNSDVTVTWECTDILSGVDEDASRLTDTVSSEGDDGVATASCTDEAGNTATAEVSGIRIDKTLPVLTRDGEAPTGWHNGDVSVTWTCQDVLSGVDEDASHLSDTVTTEGRDQTASAWCVDRAGNEATDDVGGIDIDLTDPVVDISRSPSANGYGWNNGDVLVVWTCADELSGATDDGGTHTLGEEGADQSYEATCTDHAGNTASGSQGDIDIDLTAPAIALQSRTPAPNASGWNHEDVTVTWACSDALSGALTATVSDTVSTEGASRTATGTCSDRADNTASAEVTGIKLDKTAPGVTWGGPLTDGGSYYFGSVPAAPTCAATDALSGPASCTTSGYSAAVGTHTVTATATDVAGNDTTATRTYTVLAWSLRGYYAPVDVNGVLNTVKGGSTVPLKFEAFAGAREIATTTELGATFTVKGVSCPGATTPVDDIELTTTGGTTFRYDGTAGQFIQNWQTPRSPGSCYRVLTTTADGSVLDALFKLK